MLRNKTARQHNFATVPAADVPRSIFPMRQTRKQAFDASLLVPIMCEPVYPGDVWEHTEAVMARLATPIAPLVDDLDLETWYFFVPNRITWPNWEQLITGTDDTLTTPKIIPKNAAGSTTIIALGGLFDHFGLLPQTYTINEEFNAFPFFAYFTIYNEWFRDQNLQPAWEWDADAWTTELSNTFNNGGAWDQTCLRVNKRHDYFTSSLPWAQKGDPVTIPLGSTAPVISDGTPPNFEAAGTTWPGPAIRSTLSALNAAIIPEWTLGNASNSGTAPIAFGNNTGLEVDLSAATASTINAIRLAFQTQRLLERDARGGSRYTEQILSHFRVRSPDARLQRPEYLGGSKIPVTVNPIAQTADYDTTSALGNLGAEMHARGVKKTFTYAATEHGYIIGLAAVRATPTYQQGTRRHWLTTTRLDYMWPVFSHLGEQAVYTREIFQPDDATYTNPTWGYQERFAELRYTPNEITGVLRSTAAQSLDWWHLAEEFGAEPALNAAFITDKTAEVLTRALATYPTAQWSAQIIMDINHSSRVARMLPTYGVPGNIDRF